MNARPLLLVFLIGSIHSPNLQADIFRWDNGAPIPGTEGIEPEPSVDLSRWNTDDRNLRFADFGDADLRQSDFPHSWLDESRFSNADISP